MRFGKPNLLGVAMMAAIAALGNGGNGGSASKSHKLQPPKSSLGGILFEPAQSHCKAPRPQAGWRAEAKRRRYKKLMRARRHSRRSRA
jgi:hypothetical protein